MRGKSSNSQEEDASSAEGKALQLDEILAMNDDTDGNFFLKYKNLSLGKNGLNKAMKSSD